MTRHRSLAAIRSTAVRSASVTAREIPPLNALLWCPIAGHAIGLFRTLMANSPRFGSADTVRHGPGWQTRSRTATLRGQK